MKQVYMPVWLISLSLAIFGACQEVEKQTPLPFFNQADFTPEWIATNHSDYKEIHRINDFEFTDQNGEKVNNDRLRGKVYVANFIFTVCPSICPKMTANLELVRQEFLDEQGIMFVSHSVMPWVDSVSVLKQYAQSQGLDNGQWLFLTGNKDEIYSLARNAYFAEKEMGLNKTSAEFIHTENFILVDTIGRIRGVYNGTLKLEMERLIEDIKTLRELG